VRRRLKNLNTVRRERPKLQDGMRETLRDYFADDVRRLSALLERDLSHWLDRPARGPDGARRTKA
jgi:hypothetical protein